MAPFYPANRKGEPVRVLPTLVSHPNSHSFRDGKQGMVHTADGQLQQPTVVEREQALDMWPNATAVEGVSDRVRHDLTGRSIDTFCLTTLIQATAVVQTGDPQFKPGWGQNFSPLSAVRGSEPHLRSRGD